jgi:hypothetical protein
VHAVNREFDNQHEDAEDSDDEVVIGHTGVVKSVSFYQILDEARVRHTMTTKPKEPCMVGS